MADEKILTINIKSSVFRRPKWNRSKAAARILREEIMRKTKSKNVKLDNKLNEILWKGGVGKPAKKIKVKITKIDDKTVKAELMAK